MRDIVTLTMNPAVDVSVATERVMPSHKLRCTAPQREPGGGGLNVARAIHELGGRALALYTAGGPTGGILRELVAATGIDHQPLVVAGHTRENITVPEQATNSQYRFSMPGPALGTAEWEQVVERLAALTPAPVLLVLSGSLPPGVPEDFTAGWPFMAAASARASSWIPLVGRSATGRRKACTF